MNNHKSGKRLTTFGFLMIILLSHSMSFAQGETTLPSAPGAHGLGLQNAAMCEQIEDGILKNKAVAFPIRIGTVYCLTSFDPVPHETFIYHHWFRKDSISTRIKLALKPPRWSTYSSVRLREEDKGPWRVEIRDEGNNLLQTLRFSITD